MAQIQFSVEQGLHIQEFLAKLDAYKVGYAEGIEAARLAFFEYLQNSQPAPPKSDVV